jgi:hypothetical protein
MFVRHNFIPLEFCVNDPDFKRSKKNSKDYSVRSVEFISLCRSLK